MRFMVLVLTVCIILIVIGVLFLRKYYIDWCKSFKNKRKSRELMDKIEFLVKFITVMILLIIFVITMLYDCLMKGR